VKDDTGNVGGSHKARHLFGVLLHMAIGDEIKGELAIASCGNAALAAAVVAKAADRALRVFIPTWADPSVVASLENLGARIEVAERSPGEAGDPTYLRLVEAVEQGAIPFSVQGTMTPTTYDGGRTIGWELAEQLALARVTGTVHLFVQVGGGALALSVWQGLTDGIREQWLSAEPILHTVQTESVAPLNRAWRRLLGWSEERAIGLSEPDFIDLAISFAHETPEEFMWPWEDMQLSAASGILDDFTYDWLPVVEAMLRSRGDAHVISEQVVLRANTLARQSTGIRVDPTGSAGLGGLLDPTVSVQLHEDDNVVIFFTGIDRNHN
jgi:threonine synthase